MLKRLANFRLTTRKIGVFTGVFCLILSGCGGETIIDNIDDSYADIRFVNSLDEMANFHLKRNDLLRKSDVDNLFDDKYSIVSDIETNSTSTSYRYNYRLLENAIHVGVIDSYSLTNKAHSNKTLSNKQHYWAIAWQDNDDLAITTVKRVKSDQSGVFKVRLFTHSELNYSLNGELQNTKTAKGQASDAFSITNCATGLSIADNLIDLCTADIGESYLVIADHNGLRLLLEE